jgi:5-formyltetrahydrofolate cyclo-ligase
MNKSEIRQNIKARKALLSADERRQAACRAFGMLERSFAFMTSQRILMYNALPDELPTASFLARWSGEKQLFLPRVNGDNLEILPYDKDALHRGAFNIEEPTGTEVVNASTIDLVIVPAIAYDHYGSRVGRGKGYYDRLLATTGAIKIGVGYDFQLIDTTIDVEPHDVSVDIVITNCEMLFANSSKA